MALSSRLAVPAATGSVALVFLFAYVLLTLCVGWFSRRRSGTANDFLNASRALPLPLVVAAYLAANCGALEIVGLSAMAAQYGVEAFDFYWIGAIPAMIFLALFLLPVYRRSGVRSVPEYLELRYGSSARLLNAASTGLILLLLSGIGLYAMAEVLEVVLGFRFPVSIALCSAVVLAYVLIGGVRATIYNEVLQLGVMVAGLLPLAWKTAKYAMPASIAHEGARAHLWVGLPHVAPHARADLFGLSFGLGFVLSFGYWCTDFVMMQRAFMARTEFAARQVPLWAGFGKLFFSLIVVLPGVAAWQMVPGLRTERHWDQALPALMRLVYSPDLLALGLTALAASLMSGFAGNVSAFASIWTEDIYRARLRPGLSERHYLRVARVAIVAAVVISAVASWLNFLFSNLMEHVQLIFSVLGAPFWAVFLLGMLTRRVGQRAAIAGFLCGAGSAFAHSLLVARGLLHYGSTMAADFYGASFAFLITCAVSLVWSSSAHAGGDDPRVLMRWSAARLTGSNRALYVLSIVLLLCCVALNWVWR